METKFCSLSSFQLVTQLSARFYFQIIQWPALFFDSESLTESMDQMGQRNGLRHLGTFDNGEV